MHYATIVVALATGVGVANFATSHDWPTIIILIGVMSFILPFNGPLLAHLQMRTPEIYRGRTIALFLLIFNLVGISLGPSAVAIKLIRQRAARFADDLAVRGERFLHEFGIGDFVRRTASEQVMFAPPRTKRGRSTRCRDI